MDKRRYYANKLYNLLEEASRDGVELGSLALGEGLVKSKDICIVVGNAGNMQDLEQVILLPLDNKPMPPEISVNMETGTITLSILNNLNSR